MTLLAEIVDAASSEVVSVPSLLRRVKVLASRTGTGRLAEWVNYELVGYPDPPKLPSYRGPFELPVLGHFVGPFNSEIRNVAIPPMSFPEDLREGPLFRVCLVNAVAEIEEMASRENVPTAWSADALQYYNWGTASGKIIPIAQDGMMLAQATLTIPRHVVTGVLDAVRNRALDLALEFERVAPRAGDAEPSGSERDEIQRIVNNYNFYGSTSNVAIASSHITQSVSLPDKGDETALLRFLGAAGVPPGDLVRLEEALAEDRAESGGSHPPAPGRRVRAWIARASTDLATSAAGGVIAEAFRTFFGG